MESNSLLFVNPHARKGMLYDTMDFVGMEAI